jgi:hypothetical protein
VIFKIYVESAVNLSEIYESRVVLEKSYFEILCIFFNLLWRKLND